MNERLRERETSLLNILLTSKEIEAVELAKDAYKRWNRKFKLHK